MLTPLTLCLSLHAFVPQAFLVLDRGSQERAAEDPADRRAGQGKYSKLLTSCSRYSFRKRYSSNSRLRPRRSGSFLCRSNKSSEAASRQFSWERCCSSWKTKVKEKLTPVFLILAVPYLSQTSDLGCTAPLPNSGFLVQSAPPPPVCPTPSALLEPPPSSCWVSTQGALHPLLPSPHSWLLRRGSTRELWAGLMGRIGLTNLRWEPTAAGNGGAECVAAAKLMRAIQEAISLAVLQAKEVMFLRGVILSSASPHTSIASRNQSHRIVGLRVRGD